MSDKKFIKTSSAEESVVCYQNSRKRNDDIESEAFYEEIIFHYDPLDYYNVWWKKYAWLYNFDQDVFKSDYLFCFIKSINCFKTKENLKSGGVEIKGQGTLNNYFYKTLQQHYSNEIKHQNAAKRNPTQICPICSKKTSPLSSHILLDHVEQLTDKKLYELGITTSSFDEGCPLCPKHLPRKRCKINGLDEQKKKNKIYEHIANFHSSLVLEQFKEDYPNYFISNDHTKCVSEYQKDQSEEYINLTEDYTQNDGEISAINFHNSEAFNYFIDIEMSEDERQIVEYILSSDVKTVANGKLTNTKVGLPKKRFIAAMKNIKDRMSCVGLDD